MLCTCRLFSFSFHVEFSTTQPMITRPWQSLSRWRPPLLLHLRITHSTRLFQSSPVDYFFLGVSEKAFIDPVVWLTALLTTWTAVLPSVTAHALSVILSAHDKHKIHSLSPSPVELRSKFKRESSLRRSSYAISQGSGPGRLINSATRRQGVEG